MKNNHYELKSLGMNKYAKYINRKAIWVRATWIFQYFLSIIPINPTHNKERYKTLNAKVIKTISWLCVKFNHNQNEEYAILIILTITIITAIAFSLFSMFSPHLLL